MASPHPSHTWSFEPFPCDDPAHTEVVLRCDRKQPSFRRVQWSRGEEHLQILFRSLGFLVKVLVCSCKQVYMINIFVSMSDLCLVYLLIPGKVCSSLAQPENECLYHINADQTRSQSDCWRLNRSSWLKKVIKSKINLRQLPRSDLKIKFTSIFTFSSPGDD